MSAVAMLLRRRVVGNARHNPLAAIGVVLVVVFVIFAVFAPWIAPQDPAAIDLAARLDPASHAHWFGTDELGRDILSRVIYGARISMLVGSCVVLDLARAWPHHRLHRRILWWSDRPLRQCCAHERFSFVPRNSAGHRVRRLSRSRHFQSRARAFARRMGRLCAPGSRTSSRGPRARIRGSGARPWRERSAHHRAPHSAEHYSARDRAGRHRHGRSDSRRSHHEFSWPRRAAADRKLGNHAERWPRLSFRSAAPGNLSCASGDARRSAASTSSAMRCAITSIRARASKPGFRK